MRLAKVFPLSPVLLILTKGSRFEHLLRLTSTTNSIISSTYETIFLSFDPSNWDFHLCSAGNIPSSSLVVKIACAIGGLNATIIAGSKGEHPEREMQHFWLQLPAKPCSSDKQSIQNRSMFNQ